MKLVTGLVLVIVSLVIVVLTFFPIVESEVRYQIKQITTREIQEEIVPLDTDFGIVIPKLDINARVIKEVDPYNDSVYQSALTRGVAHAKGSALPGEGGNVFIFSHSSQDFYHAVRYNSVFYLLTKLEKGDLITLYHKGSPYTYTVSDKKIVNPDEVSFLDGESDKPQLTLMTCYPPGTDIKRLIVIAN